MIRRTFLKLFSILPFASAISPEPGQLNEESVDQLVGMTMDEFKDARFETIQRDVAAMEEDLWRHTRQYLPGTPHYGIPYWTVPNKKG